MSEEKKLGKLSRAEVAGIRNRLQGLGMRLHFMATSIGMEMTYEDADALFAASTRAYKRLEDWVNSDLGLLLDNTQPDDAEPF